MAEYIEREAAIKCAEESYKMWCLTMAAADGEREINKCYKMQDVCKAIGETFKIVPAADVAPVVHGHWIKRKYGLRKIYYHCSNCHFGLSKIGHDHYCNYCGAKMDEEV